MNRFRATLVLMASLVLAAASTFGCSNANPCKDLLTTCDACHDAINGDHCRNIAFGANDAACQAAIDGNAFPTCK